MGFYSALQINLLNVYPPTKLQQDVKKKDGPVSGGESWTLVCHWSLARRHLPPVSRACRCVVRGSSFTSIGTVRITPGCMCFFTKVQIKAQSGSGPVAPCLGSSECDQGERPGKLIIAGRFGQLPTYLRRLLSRESKLEIALQDLKTYFITEHENFDNFVEGSWAPWIGASSLPTGLFWLHSTRR